MALSPEEQETLKKLQQKQKSEKQKYKEDIKTFKELSAEFVTKNIDGLVDHQKNTEAIITMLFQDYKPLKELKQLVYGKKSQDSHTSTLKDGSASITIGHNVSIKFDGTETSGVEMIKDYLASLADDNAKALKLTKIVNIALKRNAKTGFLNPAKIVELNSLRDDFDSPKFDKGLDIIIAAQIRTQNSMYVSGWKYIKQEDGRTSKLEFRFTV
ncbi:hypothetical protein [Tenacibaculum piscium]|uniref:hypothetical protein n=1 Tax=Tenacibaculum piscium TaxID=1458515 RepID=UPI001F3673A0|nr:hypothetical protein [Tenacibaculum piscium]